MRVPMGTCIIWVHQGASPLNPALQGLLQRAFGGVAPQPHPLGAPVWGHCPSDPALWELLQRAFGDTTPQAPPSRGSCQEPFRALPRKPLVEGLNKSMYFLDENILVNYIWSKRIMLSRTENCFNILR